MAVADYIPAGLWLNQKPKRNILSFSLSTLLLCVLLIGSSTTLYIHWKPWRLACELQTPKQIVMSAEFSPDGRHIVFPNSDDFTFPSDGVLVRTFDAETGTPVMDFKGNPERVITAVYSPDGNRILTTGCRRPKPLEEVEFFTRIWDARTGSQLRVLPDSTGIPFIGISPDGKTIATMNSKKGIIELWNSSGENLLGQMDIPNKGTSGFAFSPDSKRLVTTSFAFVYNPYAVVVFDVESRKAVFQIDGYTNACVTFSPDGRFLLMCNRAEDSTRVLDAKNGEGIAFLDHPGNWFAAYSPDGHRIATAGAKLIKIWDAETKELLAEIPDQCLQIHLSWSPDGNRIAVAHREGVKIWQRQRPEYRAGVMSLPEFWTTVLLALYLCYRLLEVFLRE
jgi:WD40 repeat protein